MRRAEVADAADLVRLRGQMLTDMGRPAGDDADPWRASAEDWFADRLAREREFASFVVEDPGDGVVETEARVIDLNATPDGIALYRCAGFTVPRFAALQLVLALA